MNFELYTLLQYFYRMVLYWVGKPGSNLQYHLAQLKKDFNCLRFWPPCSIS